MNFEKLKVVTNIFSTEPASLGLLAQQADRDPWRGVPAHLPHHPVHEVQQDQGRGSRAWAADQSYKPLNQGKSDHKPARCEILTDSEILFVLIERFSKTSV